MKVLYALQATGNGHISRANEIIPILERLCSVDILLSGTQADVGLNHFIKYRRKGMGLVMSKNGSIDLLKTLKQFRSKKFLEEVRSVPVEEYDLVINDFEPLSAWACKHSNIPCVALSHQFAVVDRSSPKPVKYDPLAWLVFRYYSPCNIGAGFHFKAYSGSVFTPVIRAEIRNAYTRNLGHYSVYLPTYSDKKLIRILSEHKNIQWHIFSRKAEKNYAAGNCWIRPVNNYDFVSSISTCEGILCAAGFETPAEAIFMNKKLLVVPVKGQYEQLCNAEALKELGVPVLKKISPAKHKKLAAWLTSKHKIHIPYADTTLAALNMVLQSARLAKEELAGKEPDSREITASLMRELDFVDEYSM